MTNFLVFHNIQDQNITFQKVPSSYARLGDIIIIPENGKTINEVIREMKLRINELEKREEYQRRAKNHVINNLKKETL